MSSKKPFVMLSLGALVGALVYGCSSSSSSGPATGDDAGAQDSSTHDSATTHDASSDTGGDAAAQCAPGDVSSFMAPAYVPAHQQVGACTSAQIGDFYAKCLDNTTRSKAMCDALKMAAPACTGCIESKSTDPSWGASYTHNGVISINVGGCLEILGGADGLACAKKAQAAEACGEKACAASCPVTDDASFQLYLACISQAAQNGCMTQEAAVQACEMNLNGADAGTAICLAGQNFQDIYNNVVPVFCGGGSTDAGGGG